MEYCVQACAVPAQGCTAVGVSPEEGQESDQKAGAPFLQRKFEGVGLVLLGEENTPGKPHCSLLLLEGSLQAERYPT